MGTNGLELTIVINCSCPFQLVFCFTQGFDAQSLNKMKLLLLCGGIISNHCDVFMSNIALCQQGKLNQLNFHYHLQPPSLHPIYTFNIPSP